MSQKTIQSSLLQQYIAKRSAFLLISSATSRIKQMAKSSPAPLCFLMVLFLAMAIREADGFAPYARSLWDIMLPSDDPFRILEQTPLTVPKGIETQLALARVDWKETSSAHIISLDVPGMKKENVKLEVEENRVLRISGEREAEEQVDGEKWHRAERINGKFWRQFRLPVNADLDKINAHLEDGVLKITVPKLAEERKRQPKIISIAEEKPSGGQAAASADIKVSKDEM